MNIEKNEYIIPKIELIEVSLADIIATSGDGFSGLEDGFDISEKP